MKNNEPIGERAVRLGLASQEAISAALKQQKSLSDSGRRVPLGSLLVEMGLLIPTQLVRLLEDGPLSGFHLGEDAVRLAAQLPRMLPQDHSAILFTGPRDAHGVSTVISQVGLALALMGERRVVVIDANLRHPEQHEKFRVRRSPGLAEAVSGKPSVEQCIVSTGLPGLDVLPAGNPGSDALGALISESCEHVFASLRTRYSHVLIDAPGMLDHPEAALLAPRTDGVIVVARAGRARRSDLAEVARVIEGLGVRHLGVVLTHASRRRAEQAEQAA